MTAHPTRDLALINAAGFLRSFGVGLMGVVLGIYLFRTGLTSLAIGLVIAVGLAGTALATVLVSLVADRVGRRSFLLILSLLSGVAAIALALSPSLPVLAIFAAGFELKDFVGYVAKSWVGDGQTLPYRLGKGCRPSARNHDRWVESAAVSASVLRRGRRTSKRRPRARVSFGELVEHVSPV
jgi:MFS family permease